MVGQESMGAVPSAVLAAGWIPFVIVSLLIILFSFIYIRCLQSRSDKEVCSTLTAALGLAVALFTCALVPVDIFLVSFMKGADGQFKDWARDESVRTSVENSVLYAYYGLYGALLLCLFVLLPLSYFFYEERDDDQPVGVGKRCCSAVKYSLVFVLIATILVLIGAFVQLGDAEAMSNMTTPISRWEELKQVFITLDTTHMENAVSFTLSVLTLCGMLAAVLYTAGGMTAWPIGLLRGRRILSGEEAEVEEERASIQASMRALREHPRSSVSAHDRRRIEELTARELCVERRARALSAARGSCANACTKLMRPLELLAGITLLLLAVLIFLTLLLTNIDKLMHSLGPRSGYVLPSPRLPNPIDLTLVLTQKVFPLDYLLLAGLTAYLFFCSMAGIKQLGVWFCWIRVYKIRVQHTRPQGLLFLSSILIYIVLAINVIIPQLAPQYATFGSQHLLVNETQPGANFSSVVLKPCTPTAAPEHCTVTRLSVLLFRFFCRLWIFGVLYYWLVWLFLVVCILALLVSMLKRRRSVVEQPNPDDDFSDDEPLLHA